MKLTFHGLKRSRLRTYIILLYPSSEVTPSNARIDSGDPLLCKPALFSLKSLEKDRI